MVPVITTGGHYPSGRGFTLRALSQWDEVGCLLVCVEDCVCVAKDVVMDEFRSQKETCNRKKAHLKSNLNKWLDGNCWLNVNATVLLPNVFPRTVVSHFCQVLRTQGLNEHIQTPPSFCCRCLIKLLLLFHLLGRKEDGDGGEKNP